MRAAIVTATRSAPPGRSVSSSDNTRNRLTGDTGTDPRRRTRCSNHAFAGRRRLSPMRSGRFTSVVLCYHAVSTAWDHLLSVRPEALERQLHLMLALRYRPAPAEAVVDGAGRLLHVTFDDAYRSVWNAVPVLERLRVHATVFACSDLAERGTVLSVPELAAEAHACSDELGTLDWDGLAELADQHGVEIGSHTKSHARLTMLSDAELRAELLASRKRIEDELRRPCCFLAYPYGDHDQRVRAAARRSGYQ